MEIKDSQELKIDVWFVHNFQNSHNIQDIIMLPDQLKNMFGLESEKDMSMANNIWKMLDEMAESNPNDYKNFIEKNMKEGFSDIKSKKEEKEKPYKIKPKIGFLLKMAAYLHEKMFEDFEKNQNVIITKEKWSDVKNKFAPAIKIYLNVCHSERVREPISRITKKQIRINSISEIKDIELFYYSLQGPIPDEKDKNILYFCMILNSRFCQDLIKQNGGRKILMSLSVSHLQERLMADKNILLKHYNPEEHHKLAYYGIEKMSIQIGQKNFHFLGKDEIPEFLLEKQVDVKREKQIQQEAKKKIEKEAPKNDIKFKKEEQMVQNLDKLKLNVTNPQPPKNKKVLIEVLKEEDNEVMDKKISYQMKETESEYQVQFLIPGINSIDQIDLQINSKIIKIKTKDDRFIELKLQKGINQNAVKAKMKKKLGKLIVIAQFK